MPLAKQRILTLILIVLLPILLCSTRNQPIADSLVQIVESGLQVSPDSLCDLYIHLAELSSTPNDKIQFSKSALDIAEKNGLEDSKGYAYVTMGMGFILQGDLTKALTSYFQAADIFEDINEGYGLAITYDHIANVYNQQNNHTNAILYSKKALDMFMKDPADLQTQIASSLLNIGYHYYMVEAFDSALYYLSLSKDQFYQAHYEYGYAYSIGNLGLVHSKMGDDSKATDLLNLAVEILMPYDDVNALAEYNLELANISCKLGRLSEALEISEQVYITAQEADLKANLRDACLTLSNVHYKLENHEKAYLYQKEYIAYRDSINNEATIREMADLRTEFELQQKQTELDLLHRRKQVYLILGLSSTIILMLVVALGFILYRHNRRNHNVNKVLTRQKRELQEQHDQLAALNQTKDKFFAIISHDLRGPIGAVKGTSTLIRHFAHEGSYDELIEVTELLEGSISRVSNLLDNLLEWAILQQGQFPFNPEEINVSEILDEISQMFAAMAIAKGIDLKFSIPKDLTVKADKNSFATIFRNLTDNALKFTKTDGVVQVKAEDAGEYCLITVQDNGKGMPEEKAKNLFNPNLKEGTKGTAKEKGIGLGLKLAHEFIEKNQGSVEVESKKDEGTKISVRLPKL